MKRNKLPNNLIIILLAISLVLILSFLRFSEVKAPQNTPASNKNLVKTPVGNQTPTPPGNGLGDYGGYQVVNRYPHDPGCYTQGLIYRDGYFYESCGLYGESKLRKVNPESGEVLQEVNLGQQYFAEGLIELDGLLYLLTWQEGTAFVFDLESFEQVNRFTYSSEGWGLTSDGSALILSDGSNKLYWLDPTSGFLIKESHIRWQGHPIDYLNELEYIDGKIYANIYLSDRIAIIDPLTSLVETMLDMRGLRPDDNLANIGEVLNGIAFDAENGRIFVTGKNWAWIYEVVFYPIDEPVIPTHTPTATKVTVPLPGLIGP